MDEGKNREIWNKIIIKAWKDKAFRQELLKNPSKILDEHGLRVTEGIKVDVVEDTQEHVYLHLPYAPSNVEKLSTSELEALSGGKDTISDNFPKFSKAIHGGWCPC